MSTLILVEHDNKVINPATLHVIAAAKSERPTLLVAGYHARAVADSAARLEGVGDVILADHACFEHALAEPIALLVSALSNKFQFFLAPATTFGKNVWPRVAVALDCPQISDVIKRVDEQTFERPIYAGNAIETVKVLTEKKVLTIRPTAFHAVGWIDHAEQAASIQCLDEAVFHNAIQWNQSQFVSIKQTVMTRPELSKASIVVSGGRGLQSAEQFKLIEELADVLGAAVGASRAAVDAGFISNDFQVGQTGKIVAPQLYFAVGISGAIQHMAGMKDAKIIIAINKDKEAPIFQIATYGLVGDLFQIVPELIKLLRS